MSKANYDLPETTLLAVKKLTGATSKKEAIIIAMQEYIRRKKIEKIINSYGKISLNWDRKSLQNYRG